MMSFPNVVKVAAIQLNSIFEFNSTDNRLSGFDGMLLKTLAEKLNFKYDIRLASDKHWGYLNPQGNWNGIIGMLVRGEADIGITTMTITQERFQAVDFTVPYFLLDRTFVIGAPGHLPKFEAFTYPFKMEVWVLCLVITLISTLFAQKRMFSLAFFSTFLKMVGSLVNQPLNLTVISPKKLFWVFWFMYSRAMPFFYSAILLSFLTVPERQVGIRSVEELSKAVESKTHKCLVPAGTSGSETLRQSSVAYLRSLGNTIKQNGWTYDYTNELEGLIDESTALIGARKLLQMRLGDPRSSNNVLSEDSLGVWNVGIAVRKDFCCKQQLDLVIQRVVDSGLMDKWFTDQLAVKHAGRLPNLSQTQAKLSLTIDDLSSIFKLLLFGNAMALLVFFAEHLFKLLVQKRIISMEI